MLNATFSNLVLSHASFDEAQTEFELHSSSPQVVVSLSNISFSFDFDYNITTDPELLQDIGKGSLTIESLSADVEATKDLKFGSDNNMQSVLKFDHIKISCSNFDAQFHGGDIANVANGLTGIVTAFMKEFIMR